MKVKIVVNLLKEQSTVIGKFLKFNQNWPRTMLFFASLTILLLELLKLIPMTILGIALFFKETALILWEIVKTVPEDFIAAAKSMLICRKAEVTFIESPKAPSIKVDNE